MPDSSVPNLTAETTFAPTDLLYVVKDPAGTPLDRKGTISDAVGAVTRTKIKTADTSRISTTTLAADPDLTLPVLAGVAYAFRVFAHFTHASSGDAKVDMAWPAGSTVAWGVFPYYNAAGTAANTTVVVAQGTGLAVDVPSGVAKAYLIMGTIIIGGTPGNLAFSWAQNSSIATNLLLKAGSSLTVDRAA